MATISQQQAADAAAHLAAAICAAPLGQEPAPWLFFESAFPPSYYGEIVACFARTAPHLIEVATPAHAHRRHVNYAAQRVLKIAAQAAPADIAEMEFWRQLRRVLESPAVLEALCARFADGLRARFRRPMPARQLARRVTPSLMLAQHGEGFYLGPHTDAAAKVVSAIFALPEGPGLDGLGTALYRPRQAGFTSDGATHHRPEGFVQTAVVPFRPNSAFIFLRDDRLFHGVEPLTAALLGESRRANLQFNLWQKPGMVQRLLRRGRLVRR